MMRPEASLDVCLCCIPTQPGPWLVTGQTFNDLYLEYTHFFVYFIV